jgi:hypothetical protein|tara:strand:+ start:612 stop:785 length:174 start_codon:yes stop_codon:yes gene_type:complete
MFGKLVIYDMFPNIIKLSSNDMEHALDSKKTLIVGLGLMLGITILGGFIITTFMPIK